MSIYINTDTWKRTGMHRNILSAVFNDKQGSKYCLTSEVLKITGYLSSLISSSNKEVLSYSNLTCYQFLFLGSLVISDITISLSGKLSNL